MELTIDQALRQGVAAHKGGKLQDAERLYRAILQAQPNHPDANHNLGVLAVSVGKLLEAIPLFKLAVEANPQIEQFWWSYIDALIKVERFDDAKRVLGEVEGSGVSSKKLEFLRQQIQAASPENKKSTRQGLTVSEKRKKLAGKKNRKKRKAHGDASGAAPSQDQINRLARAYHADRLAEAEEIALSLSQKFPRHPFGWKVLGVLLKKTGRLNESLLPMQKSAELSPHDAETHGNLGATLQKLGRLDEAESSYRQAIALKPDYAEAHSNLALTLQELGRLDDAEASYRQAIVLKPDFAEARNNFGNTLKELGRLDEAEASYSQAITLKPDYAEAYSNLGVTLQELGRLDEAEANFRRAIALKPDHSEAHNNLGNTLKELGRLNEAEVSYGTAIALKPDYVEACISLGTTLQKLKRLGEAEQIYKQAVLLQPDAGSAAHMLSALTGENTARAPLDYVESLFDGYAAKFDSSLVDQLDYRTPKAIAELIAQKSDSESLGSVLDLGCGTGLFGIEIAHACERIEGLDVSRNMLLKAQERGVYDQLVKQDIESYLSNETLNFDYFVATDVFVYIGDLTEVFLSIKSRNKSSGRLVFSVEHLDGDGFALQPSGRYAHSRPYIDGLCKEFQYQLEYFATQDLRLDGGSYILGGLYLLSF